jgi:aminoglycoside 6'-N-acetyltransferase
MAPVRYAFRPMEATDLPLLRRWLAMPHVVEWWGQPDEQFDLVSGDLSEPAMEQFIVTTADRPIGYIQSYSPEDWGIQPFGNQPGGTRGIDQFIGEPDMVGRGHGSAFIRAFIDKLVAKGAPRVLTDPDPKNGRAIRAYEKAGFQRERLVQTSEGIALLMVHDA